MATKASLNKADGCLLRTVVVLLRLSLLVGRGGEVEREAAMVWKGYPSYPVVEARRRCGIELLLLRRTGGGSWSHRSSGREVRCWSSPLPTAVVARPSWWIGVKLS
jgi:hypothetical protein